MITRDRTEKRKRLKRHIRLVLAGTTERPRLTVFRSLKHVYAQLVDDSTGKTLVSVSDITQGPQGSVQGLKGQVAIGKKVGQLAARKALDLNIKRSCLIGTATCIMAW